jgi:hypothetical protein
MTMNYRRPLKHRQKGAVIVTVALALLFLLGFMAIALDFGHLFVVKTELQTAVDSCALAAAQELDGAPDALPNGGGEGRATNAGIAAGNLNKVNFQGASAGFVAADITFSDSLTGSYSHTFAPPGNAKYAKCTRTKSGMAPWLMQAMGAFLGNPAYKANQSVSAVAVATLASAQTSCMLPIGICDQPGGFQPGEWILGAVNSSEAVSGQFHWLDFTGNPGGKNDVKALLQGEGQCSLPGANSVVRESGNAGSASSAYNTRFGIYQGSKGPPDDGIPDLTGYAYYADTPPSPYPDRYNFLEDPSNSFKAKRAANAKYQGDNAKGKGGTPDNLGLDNVVPPGKIDSAPLSAGANRRIVTAPIVNCPIPNSSSTPVQINRVACILLLHPIRAGGGPSTTKMWVEYLGAANAADSPCTTFGLAGGAGGPLVPTLVQ